MVTVQPSYIFIFWSYFMFVICMIFLTLVTANKHTTTVQPGTGICLVRLVQELNDCTAAQASD